MWCSGEVVCGVVGRWIELPGQRGMSAMIPRMPYSRYEIIKDQFPSSLFHHLISTLLSSPLCLPYFFLLVCEELKLCTCTIIKKCRIIVVIEELKLHVYYAEQGTEVDICSLVWMYNNYSLVL